MRKQSKSLISMILTAAMVVSLGAGTVTGSKASAEDAPAGQSIGTTFQAFLCQNNSKIFDAGEDSIGTNDAGETVAQGVVASSGAISTTGVYTVGATVADDVDGVDSLLEEAQYLGLEFGDLGKTMVDGKANYKAPTNFSIKPLQIKITHSEKDKVDTIDWSKAVLYNDGDKETNHLRLGIVNNYASKKKTDYPKANPFMKNINGTWKSEIDEIAVHGGDTFEVVFEVSAEAPKITPTPVPTAKPTAPPAKASYDAYLGFQTDNYIFRDPWNKDETGLNSKDYKYNSQVALSTGGKTKAFNATIKNSTMTDNTTYTVSISGVNMKTIKGDEKDAKTATQFNMLYVTTGIPLTMKNVTAVNASLKIDGKTIKTGMTLPNKPDAEDYYQFMVADAYSEDDGIKNVAYPKASPLKILPTSSIEITFTLKGADFSGKDYGTKTIGVKKGKTFTSGNFKYKVTKSATITAGKKAQGKVTVVGLSSKGKKASKLSVGKTVSKTVNKVKATYKITKLGTGAFKSAKAKSVTLSKNIKSIPASAFKNCKKLNKLTLKAKLSSVKKGAFNGCKKTIKVSGTSKKANVKKLKKSGYKKFK